LQQGSQTLPIVVPLLFYRGKKIGYDVSKTLIDIHPEDIERVDSLLTSRLPGKVPTFFPRYQEHNEEYLIECVKNLKGKGITIQ